MFVFTSAGEKALYFSPAGSRFPVSRAVSSTRAADLQAREDAGRPGLDGADLLDFVSCSTSNSWLSAFVGIFLTLAFVQLLALVTAFLGQIVAEQAYTRRRRLILLSIGVLVFAALAQVLWQTPVQSPAELARSFRASWTGMVLLAPFEVFSHAILATNWFPDLVCWGAGALAIDLVLLALIFRLDADYLESAAAISQKLYEKVQRMKQGGGIALPASAESARDSAWRRFPWLGGAGPLAWRQILIAVRTSKVCPHHLARYRRSRSRCMAFVGDRESRRTGFRLEHGRRVHGVSDFHFLDAASLGVSRRHCPHGLSQVAAGGSAGGGAG